MTLFSTHKLDPQKNGLLSSARAHTHIKEDEKTMESHTRILSARLGNSRKYFREFFFF